MIDNLGVTLIVHHLGVLGPLAQVGLAANRAQPLLFLGRAEELGLAVLLRSRLRIGKERPEAGLRAVYVRKGADLRIGMISRPLANVFTH